MLNKRLFYATAAIALLSACAGGEAPGVLQPRIAQNAAPTLHAMAYPQPTGVPTVNPALHNKIPFGTENVWHVPIPGELQGITVGSDDNLWFANSGSNIIESISTTGTFGSTITPLTSGSGPVHLATGSDGALWFSENTAKQVANAYFGGKVTEWNARFCGSGGGTARMTQGPDGNIWVVDPLGNEIDRVTPSGSITQFPVTGTPIWIAVGPDGNLWYTEYVAGKIGKMNTNGQVLAQYSLPTTAGGPLQGPWSIAPGPDGNMWFAEWPDQVAAYGGTSTRSTGYVYSITPSGSITRANYPGWPLGIAQIATGPDGNIYWANWGNGGSYPSSVYVYSVAQQKQIGSYTLGVRVEYLTAGPDGNMWVVDVLGGSIYRLGTGV